MKKTIQDILIVGFALFSMLFGAGNVIFPPYLGLGCGPQWMQGFLFYYIADIGLALTCLFAIQRCGGHRAITGHLGKHCSELLICVITLCIGPMVAIPRTAASTFEMSILPLFPQWDPVLFSILFFILVILLCINENSVIDIIGKLLTPLLIAGLLVLIIKGTVHPIGQISNTVLVSNVPVTGINAGYQTMDVLAMVIFGTLISRSVRSKGYIRRSQQNRIILGSGLIAGVSLLVIYLGLAYLGATAGSLFDLGVDHTFLITSIVHLLLGQAGTVLFSVVVALACLTTAVALVSSCSAYFSTLSKGKISYFWIVCVICGSSAFVTTFGLNQIISIAAPILDIIYPPTLLVILLSFFDRWIDNDWVYRLGALGALLYSIMNILNSYGAPFSFLRELPLYSYGFGWTSPALLCAVCGLLLPSKKKKRSE